MVEMMMVMTNSALIMNVIIHNRYHGETEVIKKNLEQRIKHPVLLDSI